MKELTEKERTDCLKNQQNFEKYCLAFPHAKKSNRGEPFWHNHLAKRLLGEDVKNVVYLVKRGSRSNRKGGY